MSCSGCLTYTSTNVYVEIIGKSYELWVASDEFETEDPILAPGLDVGPSIPGMPGFVFE